jgi:hypothetical protein
MAFASDAKKIRDLVMLKSITLEIGIDPRWQLKTLPTDDDLCFDILPAANMNGCSGAHR